MRFEKLSIITLILACGATALAQAPPDVAPVDAGTPPPAEPESTPSVTSDAAIEDDTTATAPVEPPAPEPVPAAVTPAAVLTDASEPAAVEEMVVTAQRRRTNLQTTPIAITALSADTLRERSAVDLRGVTQATPNVELTTSSNASGGSNFAQAFIRGVGQPDFYITKDPGVGIYVDGVYLARAPGALLELLDIERIEVLRGPQGTLFGKNTAGGAIHVITQKPDGSYSGVAEVRGGTYARRDIGGSFQAPLVEKRLFMRVSGLASAQDGYYERLDPGAVDGPTADGNNVNSYTGRLSLRWVPTDDFDVLIAADGTLQRQTATDYQAVGIFESANTKLYNQLVLAPQGEVYDSRWVAPRPWTTYSNSPSYNNTDVWGVSGTLTWDLDPLQLKSITAYRDLRAAAKTDADGTPFDIVASDGLLVNQWQISQELQLTGNVFDNHLAWVVGLWYFEEHAQDDQSLKQLVGLFEALEAAPPRSVAPPPLPPETCPLDGSGPMACLGGPGNMSNLRFDATRQVQRKVLGRSYAAFGQASIKATDELSFTAGARISREEKDFTYYETRPLQNNRVSFDNVKASPSWNVFTPKLGVEYRFTHDLMTYASFAVGFKAGGITGRPPAPDQFKTFDPEWLTTYEVGVKSDWFDRRLRVNVAGFYSIYRDIQMTRNTVDSMGSFIRLEDNAGDGLIAGFEVEASAVPIKGLNLSANAGFTHFEFTSLLPQMVPPNATMITLDNKLPFIPVFDAAFSASYRIPLGEAGFLTPRVDLNYSSGYFTDIDNTKAVEEDGYVTLNARMAYNPRSGSWELFVAGTNLTNEAVVGASVAAPANGSHLVSYLAPRMFLGGARFNFD